MLRQIAQLSSQLMSTLPIESKTWSKLRIENQNRIIEEFLQAGKEEQLPMNYNAIIASLNERMRFIEQIQDSFFASQHQERNDLAHKLNLLKKPFNLHKKTESLAIREQYNHLSTTLEAKRDKIMGRSTCPAEAPPEKQTLSTAEEMERRTVGKMQGRHSVLNKRGSILNPAAFRTSNTSQAQPPVQKNSVRSQDSELHLQNSIQLEQWELENA
jgi:hypothetical protein